MNKHALPEEPQVTAPTQPTQNFREVPSENFHLLIDQKGRGDNAGGDGNSCDATANSIEARGITKESTTPQKSLCSAACIAAAPEFGQEGDELQDVDLY